MVTVDNLMEKEEIKLGKESVWAWAAGGGIENVLILPPGAQLRVTNVGLLFFYAEITGLPLNFAGELREGQNLVIFLANRDHFEMVEDKGEVQNE